MNKNRILIADDVDLNREMLAEILGNKYEFVYASSGVEVIDKIRGEKDIDLILLDINMPQMDGFEVLNVMNERHWIEEFPVIVISADDSSEFITKSFHLGAIDYIARPFRSIIVQRKVENTLLMFTNQKRLLYLIKDQVREKEKVNNSLINIFSNVIELRNHESGSHTLNVQTITKLLLTELAKITDRYQITKADIALISSLAALHDIGKIKTPDAILNKPGKLTDEEWVTMKRHTVDGEELLKKSAHGQDNEFIHTACAIARWHHEKYNGTGYPDGLKGDDIPIEAQVVSLADCYDALTSERCYKHAYTHETAVTMLLSGACGQFNPLLLECLKKIAGTLKEIKEVGTSYNYQNLSDYISDELLLQNGLPVTNSIRRMMDNERMKKDFFMDCAEGIQCEYDKLLGKATFVYRESADDQPSHKIMFTLRDSKENILPTKYWDILHDKLMKTTRENPIAYAEVKLLIHGNFVPYNARVMAIWPEDGSEYIFVMCHFTKCK